jgi:hypothetical protein
VTAYLSFRVYKQGKKTWDPKLSEAEQIKQKAAEKAKNDPEAHYVKD